MPALGGKQENNVALGRRKKENQNLGEKQPCSYDKCPSHETPPLVRYDLQYSASLRYVKNVRLFFFLLGRHGIISEVTKGVEKTASNADVKLQPR